jgi:hypothetical protein
VATNPGGVGGAAQRPRKRLSRRRRSAIVRGLRSLTPWSTSLDASSWTREEKDRSTGTVRAITRGSKVLDLPVSEPRQCRVQRRRGHWLSALTPRALLMAEAIDSPTVKLSRRAITSPRE